MDGQRSEHVGKLSWRMTVLNCCTVTESLWKRKAVCRSSWLFISCQKRSAYQYVSLSRWSVSKRIWENWKWDKYIWYEYIAYWRLLVSIAYILLALCRWYHGRLDRNVAEDRLRQAKQMGSYLIRESDRKPGSYVLSFFGQKGMNHFRLV